MQEKDFIRLMVYENTIADMYCKDIEYHKRIRMYLCPNKEERQLIPKYTNGLGNTQTCRQYFKEIIKNYEKKQLDLNGERKLCLARDGEFYLEDNDGKCFYARDLKEKEKMWFELKCFLEFSRMWSGLEKIKDFNYEEKPIIIAGRLDDLGKDKLKELAERESEKMNRQIIVK